MGSDTQRDALNFKTVEEIAAFNRKKAGGRWFDRGAFEFFHTKIESGVVAGRFFITSEQMDEDSERRFTVREVQPSGTILTRGGFHEHATLQDAGRAAVRAATEANH